MLQAYLEERVIYIFYKKQPPWQADGFSVTSELHLPAKAPKTVTDIHFMIFCLFQYIYATSTLGTRKDQDFTGLKTNFFFVLELWW